MPDRSRVASPISKEVSAIHTTRATAGCTLRPALMALPGLASCMLMAAGPVLARPGSSSHTAAPGTAETGMKAAINPAALVSMARARQLMTHGVDDLAEPELKNAANLAPNWIDAQRELARWYTRHQRWAEASYAWRAVLRIDRNDTEAKQQAVATRQHVPPSWTPGNVVGLGISSNSQLGAPSAHQPITRGAAETRPRLAQANPSTNPTTATGGSSASPTGTPNNGGTAGTGGTAGSAGAVHAAPAPTPLAHSGSATVSSTPAPKPVKTTSHITAPIVPPSTSRRNQQGAAAAAPTPVASNGGPTHTAARKAAKTIRMKNRRGKKGGPAAASTTTAAATGTPVSKKRQAAAWPLVEQANRAFQAHRAQTALELYRRARETDPNNPFAQRGIAESLFVRKQWHDAAAAYRTYLGANPNDDKKFRQKSWAALGDALTAQKKYGEAIPAYKQAAGLDPTDYATIFQLARALTWTKQYNTADDYYRQALELQPNNAVAWTAYGEAMALNNNIRARDAFLRALKLTDGKPKAIATNTRAALGLANFYSWKGQYDEAVGQYQSVLARDPNNRTALTGIADALTFSGQAAQAIPHYEQILNLTPNSRTAELGLGRALVLAGRNQDGLAHLNAVLQADPKNLEALRMTALGESNLDTGTTPAGQKSRALVAYEKLMATMGDDTVGEADVLSNIGRLRAKGGDFAGSLDAYGKAHQLSPENNDISLDYARVLYLQNQFKEANPLIEDVLARDPNNVRARVMQVAVVNGLGYHDRAVRLVSELENLDIANPSDAFELATALNGAGNPEAARRVLQRFANKVPDDPAMALRVANAIRDAGDYDTATTVYQKIITANPNNLDARTNYAKMLSWQRHFDEAQKELAYVLDHDKNNLPAQELMTTVQLNMPGGRKSATELALAILAKAPNNVTANITIADVNMGEKKFAEASENYRAALKTEPSNPDLHLGLARSLYYGRQIEDAISEYQRLIQMVPTNNKVKLELAKVYLDRNRPNDAELLYNQVLESQHVSLLTPTARTFGRPEIRVNAHITPLMMESLPSQTSGAPAATSARATLPQARIFLAQATTPGAGAPGAAAAGAATANPPDASAGVTTAPANTTEAAVADQVAALRGLGEVRRLELRYPEAADYFRQALKLDDTDTGSRVGLAQSLRAQGDFVTALTEVERALNTAPTNLQARVLHAQLLGDTGKSADAQAELDRLVADLTNATNVPVETYLTLAQSFNNLHNYDASLQLLGTARQTFPDQPIVSRTIAETHTFAHHWDQALDEYDKLLAANPKDVDATLGKARVYNYSNRLEQAEPMYRQVLELEPNNYQGLVELADVLARRGNWTDAVARYREAIDKNPNDLGIRVELARTLRYNHQYDEAETELNKVVGTDAKYAPAYTERGILRGQEGHYDAAIADLRQALTITPQDLNAQFGLAEVLGYAGNYDDSIAQYQAALQRDPQNEKGRVELGLVMSYAKRYKDAIKEFNTVLQQNPQNVNAKIGKADALARSGNVHDSVALYNAVLQAEPNNRRAHLGIAEAYVYGREYDRSLAEYDALIRAEPANVSYRVARARTLGYAGRNAQAVAQLRPIVAQNPNNVEARTAMAEAMTNSTDPSLQAQAIPQYQMLLNADPSNVSARLGLGRAYSYTGHYTMAINEFNRILSTQPRNQAALYALAETQRFAGDPFSAEQSYNRVLAANPNDVGARTGLGLVHRQTAPYVTAYARHYDDTNGVRLNIYGAGATYRSRPLTVGVTAETGNFSQNGVKFPRHATSLLLGHNFGYVQARLLLNQVHYSGAPSRGLYDLLVERPIRQRKRYYVDIARRENLESRQALTQKITMQEEDAGFQYPLASRIDWSADVARIHYSDNNTRTNLGTSLMYRLKQADPTFRFGLGYSHQNTDKLRSIYYTPQGFNALSALADYSYDNRNNQRFGIFAAYPLTNRTGNGGVNRPAKTLFGYWNYDLSDALSVFLNGGIVRAPNFRSNDVGGGVNLRF